jgi:SPP1 family predicted phage head-tail adaptor
MRAGRLDTPITIKSLTTSVDSMGAPTETYAELSGGPKWAQYIPMRGEERQLAGQLSEVVDFKLRIRRDTNVNSTCRVTVRGSDYKIVGMPEDNLRDGDMVIHCRSIE